MFFFLKYKFNSPSAPIKIEQMEGTLSLAKENTLYLRKGFQGIKTLKVAGGKLIIMGDPICSDWATAPGILSDSGKLNENALYEEIKGHYYWFFIQKQNIQCGASFGAIFPVYYHIDKDQVWVSSSSFYLAEKTNAKTRDKRNLLERLLFNYTFFNSTWWKDIKLLDAHRYLNINGGGVSVEGRFDLSYYFGEVEDHSRKSLDRLAALFQEEVKLFFPEEPFGISMTGGFDGRTLVAAARKAKREFITYSFGKGNSLDVSIPMEQAKKLKIPYLPVYLEKEYVEKEAFNSAHAFMELTEYNGNWGRPHYHYATQVLSQQVKYIITGNFGSEFFRAFHSPGVMVSESLIKVFAAEDNSWKDHLIEAASPWGLSLFQQELDALIADIEKHLRGMKGWDPNHKFYTFVINEIFRKYFGPELIMQSHYFNNRTPYLNLRFFQELNRTIWSGVHARLFEKMLNKRMKGQMFYASFMKKTDKKMYHLKTSKGYSPADVLEQWRLPFLVGGVVLKKYIKKGEMDPHSVGAFFKKYHGAIAKEITGNGVFPFINLEIVRSLKEIPKDINPEKWIKFYAIASGWQASGLNLHPIK